jgi:hypothetical protein
VSVKSTLRPVRRWARRCLDRLRVRINRQPVIVLGNPKSGTTAIAALLAEFCGLTAAAHGLPWLYEDHIEEFARRELTLNAIIANNRRAFAAGVIKEPFLTQLYGDLHTRFPHSPFIFIVRDPRDNIRSILDRVRVPGNLERIPDDLWRSIPPAWQETIRNQFYGLTTESYIESLAIRWSKIARIYLEDRDRLILCPYEQFLADKETEIRRLAEAVGRAQAADIRADLDKQFQPRGQRNVNWLDFFGPSNLETINRVCEAEMAALGYAPAAICPSAF